jgi:malate synthase
MVKLYARGARLYMALFHQNMAYPASCDLVFKGNEQPLGYTEPLMHAWRLKVKTAQVR